MPERDELDRLIDSELARYAEPRAGLEQRMLARASGEAVGSSRRRRFMLAIAAPVVASLACCTYLLLRTSHSQPGQMTRTTAELPLVHTTAPPELLPVPRSLSGTLTRGHTALHRVTNTMPHPKLDLFPTIRPLNEAEETVYRFGREAPETDRKALVATQQQLSEPIRISAIHIPPLPKPEEGKN